MQTSFHKPGDLNRSLSMNGNSFEQQSSNSGYCCRICLERISQSSATNSEVTSPCKCSGSVKFIHVKCLKEWMKAKGSIQCEICHNLYEKRWVDWAFEKNLIK